MNQPGTDKDEILSCLKKDLGSFLFDFSQDLNSDDIQEELAVCDDWLLNCFLEGKKGCFGFNGTQIEGRQYGRIQQTCL